MSDKQLLQCLQRGERLNSPALADLASLGLITVDDATNNDSLPVTKEYLFISFTEAGKNLLESNGGI